MRCTPSALYLGVFNLWCAYVIWAFIDGICWARGHTIDEVIDQPLIVMKTRLEKFYCQRKALTLTGIYDIANNILGGDDDQRRKMKTKGAGTYGFMLFLI